MIGRRFRHPGSRAFRTVPRGQAQVEFVLTILFVTVLLLGIIELIMLIYTYNVLADSAKEGVRYAVVHGCDLTNCSGTCSPACPDPAADNVKAWVLNFAQASLHDTSTMTVAVNYLDTGGTATPPSRVQVTVSYPYQPFFGFSWPSVTVQAAAEGRIVY